MSKEKANDFGLGDFMVPLVELFGVLFVKGIELFKRSLFWGVRSLATKGKSSSWLGKWFEKNFQTRFEAKLKKIERKDLLQSKVTIENDALGYSITKKREIKNYELNKSKHTVVVGASGSGKSALLDTLIFSDLKEGKPVVFIDPKGDRGSMEQFINLCRHYNRDFQIFSEHYQGPNKLHLNPVKEGSYTQIADRIFKAFTWSEEYYATKCRQALKEAIKHLCIEGQEVSLKSIYLTIINLSDPYQDNPPLKRSEVEGLLARLDNIVDSDFEPILEGEEALSFREVRKTGKCVYIGLSVLGYAETARSLGKLLLGDLNYSVYDSYKYKTIGEKDAQPLGLYIDELSAVITDEFIEILNKCRGAKLEITTAFQSVSDINKVDPELSQQVLENSLNWFVMKQRMTSASELLAHSIGTMESSKQTVRVQDGEKQDQGSQRDVEELIVHPNVIKNLGVGQAILLRQQPTQIDLLNIKYIDPQVLKNNIFFLENKGWISQSKMEAALKEKGKRDIYGKTDK